MDDSGNSYGSSGSAQYYKYYQNSPVSFEYNQDYSSNSNFKQHSAYSKYTQKQKYVVKQPSEFKVKPFNLEAAQ